MRRIFLLVALLLPLRVWSAAGDFIGARTDVQGWHLILEFSAMDTNGTFDFGLGRNNATIGTEKCKVNLVSQGFDSTGAATTYARTLIGTKQLRWWYDASGMHNFPDVTTNAATGVTQIKLALSDFVYADDISVTVTLLAGLYYTNGVTNAVVTSAVVTNLSTRVYPPAVANWTWPGWNRITNGTMRLRAVGFAQTAENGQPLMCMKFKATDGTTTVTNTVAAMAIDRTLPDTIPTAEYFTDISMATLTPYANGGANGQIRCDFEAYPRLGTTATIFSTSNSTILTAQAATITNLYDLNLAYCSHIAVVDPAGNDTNGRVTNVAPASVNSAHYFATLRGAAFRMAATNNSYNGHNDPGGGIIYVRSDVTNYSGASGDITTTPICWLEIVPYPGDVMSNLNTLVQTYYLGHRIKFHKIPLGGGGSAGLFFGVTGMWWDQCEINSTASALIRSAQLYATHCTIPRFDQGFSYSSGFVAALIRGCKTTGAQVGGINPVHTVIGNHFTSNYYSGVFTYDLAGMTTPLPLCSIVYNNRVNNHLNGSANRLVGPEAFAMTNSRGMAIIQNVFESSTNNAGPLVSIGSIAVALTNVILWHNVFLGGRMLLFYNDSGAGNVPRDQCQMMNNVIDRHAVKTDTYVPGLRTNNWQQVWGVGWSGNSYIECTNVGGLPGEFNHEYFKGFRGLNSPLQDLTSGDPLWAKFIDRKAQDGITHSTAGEGNYRVHSYSPLQGINIRRVLPYDLEGNARGALDPAGPYASASPRKGAGFFAP